MLEALVARYGLIALFLGAGIEGETIVVLGGIMVHRGSLPLLPAIAAAAAGSCIADQIFFALGRRFRDHRFVRRIRDRHAFTRALTTFERHPTAFVFAFRFLYGLRTVSPVAIGTTTLPTARFMAVNAASALLWGAIFISAGYLFGRAIETTFGRIRPLEHVLIPAAVLILVLAVGQRWWRRRR
ncbi:membrane protein DedA with SNARE-associated domain [Sphingomonas zeicaulis]|uniref:DedA family protein n=1 Tax=Sphingomonas zeicaulis TaxID=1632740 RepID=UPI003D258AF3